MMMKKRQAGLWWWWMNLDIIDNEEGDDDEGAGWALVVGWAGQINTTNCHSRPTASQYTLRPPQLCLALFTSACE